MTDARVGELVREHQDRVYRIALAVLGPGSESDAEDVAQEVFLKMMRSLRSFRGESALTTWLHRVTWNTAVSSRRRLRHTRPHLPVEAGVLDRSGADAVADRDASNRAVRQLVDALPDEDRALVHLCYWLGHSATEIAAMTGRPSATIRSRLLRARRKLAKELER